MNRWICQIQEVEMTKRPLGPLQNLCCCCCSITQLYMTLCNPMDCSTAGFLSFTVSRSLLRFLSIGSVIASNHLTLCCLLLPLPSVFPASGVLQWVVSWHQAAKVLELQLQHQSFQWIFRIYRHLKLLRDFIVAFWERQLQEFVGHALQFLIGSRLTQS